MPCDIGWRAYERVTIPAPLPQDFTVKAQAPDINEDLMEKLGVEDPEFLDGISQMDVKPLLEQALERALEKVDKGGLDFSVGDDGMLKASGSFVTADQKRRLKAASDKVMDRWQMEILGIVTELLGYDVIITQNGDEITIEASESGKHHPCDYIKITRKGGKAEITFEHFKSKKALELAMGKFEALARKLGVKIAIKKPEIKEGDPFPNELREGQDHHHHHGHSHKHGHDHEH